MQFTVCGVRGLKVEEVVSLTPKMEEFSGLDFVWRRFNLPSMFCEERILR